MRRDNKTMQLLQKHKKKNNWLESHIKHEKDKDQI